MKNQQFRLADTSKTTNIERNLIPWSVGIHASVFEPIRGSSSFDKGENKVSAPTGQTTWQMAKVSGPLHLLQVRLRSLTQILELMSLSI